MSAPDQSIITAATQLLLHPQRHVHRRVDNVSFVSDEVLRVRIEWDLTIPEQEEQPVPRRGWFLPEVASEPRETYVLPLMLARKGAPFVSVSLDVRGAGHGSILNTRQSIEMTREMVARAAQLAAASGDEPLDEAEVVRLVARFVRPHQSSKATTDALLDWGRGLPESADRSRLLSLVRDLRRAFPLMVATSARPGDRVAVEFSTDHRVRTTGGVGLAGRIFTPQLRYGLSLPGGGAESHHVEIEVPTGLEIVTFQFSSTAPKWADQPSASLEPEVHGLKAHILSSATSRPSGVELRMQPSLRGWFGRTAVLVVVNAVVLVWGNGALSDLASGGSSTTGVVLGLASLPATLLAQPFTHDLAGRATRGRRVLAVISGLAVLVAGVALVVAPGEEAGDGAFAVADGTVRIWAWASSVSVVVAVAWLLLAAGTIAATPFGRRVLSPFWRLVRRLQRAHWSRAVELSTYNPRKANG